MAKRQSKKTKPTQALSLTDIAVPLRVADGGVVRVGKTRVSLDVVIEQYENGATPEDMVRAYDTLELADVHATIAYYLRHRDAVNEYMRRRAKELEDLRREIEDSRRPISRKKLLSRRNKQKDHASTSE